MERPSLPELRVPAARPKLAGRPPHLRVRKRLITPAPVPPVVQAERAPKPTAAPAAAPQPPVAAPEPPVAAPEPPVAAPAVPELPPVAELTVARPAEPVVTVAEIAPPSAATWGVCHRVALPEPAVPVAPAPPNPAVGIVGAGLAGMVASVVIALAASGGFGDDWAVTGDERSAAQPAVAEVPAQSEVAPQPVVEPKPIVVPIDNTVAASFTVEPEGARVTLVEDGEPIPLGLAPVEARLDPNRAYELLVEHDDYWSDVRLIVFDGGDVREHVELTRKDEPAVAQTKVPVQRRARRAPAGKRRATRARAAAAEIPAGKGILMLHAKPPCAIEIDGRDTGLTTPRRDIALTPGRHRITLVNRDHGIREQLFVTIREGRELKVSKDLTDRMAVDVPRL